MQNIKPTFAIVRNKWRFYNKVPLISGKKNLERRKKKSTFVITETNKFFLTIKNLAVYRITAYLNMSNSTIKIVPAGENKYKLVFDRKGGNNLTALEAVLRLSLIANECFGSWCGMTNEGESFFSLNAANGATPEIFKRFLEHQFAEDTFDCSLI